jgi:hypothetical protein
LGEAEFKAIREKLNTFIKDAIATATESQPDRLVCLNIDFFKPVK